MKLRNIALQYAALGGAALATVVTTATVANAKVVDKPRFKVDGIVLVWGGTATNADATVVSDFYLLGTSDTAGTDLIANDDVIGGARTVLTGSFDVTSGDGGVVTEVAAGEAGVLDATDVLGAFAVDGTNTLAGLVPPAKGRFFVASNTGFQIKAQATADTNNSGGFTLANVAYDLNMTVASNSSFDGASSATSFATGASAQDPCSSDVAGGTTGPVLGTVTGANCGVVSAVDALDDLATEAVVYRANRLTAASPGTIAAQSVRFDTTYTFDSDTSQTGVQGYDLSDGTFDYGADVVYTIYAP